MNSTSFAIKPHSIKNNTLVDPRTRVYRHTKTPDVYIRGVLIKNVPSNWDEQTVLSVVAGSGAIIGIKQQKLQPSTNSNNFIIIYTTSNECKKAYDLISKIENKPFQIEQVLVDDEQNEDDNIAGISGSSLSSVAASPSSFSSSSSFFSVPNSRCKALLKLKRDNYPWDYNLQLPFEMISEVPLPKKNKPIFIPELLIKASSSLPKLPPINKNTGDGATTSRLYRVNDVISSKISKIQPPQLIEIIANLTSLANSINASNSIAHGANNNNKSSGNNGALKEQISSFLQNGDVALIVTQGLLEMGLVDIPCINMFLESLDEKNGVFPSTTVSPGDSVVDSSSLPITTNTTASSSSSSISVSNTPSVSPINTPTSMNNNVNTIGNNPIDSVSRTTGILPQHVEIKLSKLNNSEQANVIRQILTLTRDQILLLPPKQRTMVENIHREYL
ncbi:uncharacterized protein SCODWIG_00326 [Saccharomycodes ludwigii]|uniref:RRM domain-containing protein n=1 Tax=Saccharomycodes ludwigii TaxID=36035 RepID=A0A376B1K8_9ASCO|nr:hypothetical protein SCDLUD_001444 [Saccharomycodes ludwigii]KAH3901674.1 hypothetical protein SCDLUD_001444 [Saccharomycodes ludwigii]SSD58565.1 uncharacterized protein SCODWIG_00326 [Saccharomycodes ludwigii]